MITLRKNKPSLKEAMNTKIEYKPVKIEYKHRGTVDFEDNFQGYNETERGDTERIIVACIIALIFFALLSSL